MARRVGILAALGLLFVVLAGGFGEAQAVFAGSRIVGASIFAVGQLFSASPEVLLVEAVTAGEKAAEWVGSQVAVVSWFHYK